MRLLHPSPSFSIKLALLAAGAIFSNLPGSFTSGSSGRDVICAPKEWFGGKSVMTLSSLNGKQSVSQSMTIYYYSALQRKLVLIPMFKKKRLIYDFSKAALYTIEYFNSGFGANCSKGHLEGTFPEICVPANYDITVDPHTMIGAGKQVTYVWEAKGMLGNLRHRMTMSVNNLPVYEELQGLKNGGPYFQNVYYYNTTKVTFSPSTFNIPNYCP